MAAELPSSEEKVQTLLQSAVLSRASHIRKEAETITMANVRRLLETDLGLEKSALDVHKLFIRQLVDEVLLSSENAEGQDEEAAVSEEVPKRKKKSSGKKAREGNRSPDQTEEKDPEDLQENDHVESPTKKKQKKEKAKKEKSNSEEDEDGGGSHAELSEEGVNLEAPKEKSQKSKPENDKEEIKEVDEDGGGSQSEMSEEDSDVSERRKPNKAPSKTASVKPVQNRKIEHLKKIIKACGLTIPPQIYKRAKQQPEEKQDKFLIKEVEDILRRRGLSSDPSEKEIKAAKRKIATEKDLEGIDTTNIILEPRGRRATSQLFTPVYNPPPLEYDSEQDDDGKDDDEEDDDNAGSDDEEKDFVAAGDSDNSD